MCSNQQGLFMSQPSRVYRNSVVYPLYSSGSPGQEHMHFSYHCSKLHVYTMSLSDWEKLPLK